MRKRYHWLAELINVYGYQHIAEVGAATGNTTKYLLDHCKSIKSYIVADDWRPVFGSKQWSGVDMKEAFLRKVGRYEKLRIVEGVSWEMSVKVEDESLDLVFIDASHDKESVMRDIMHWLPKLKPNGVLTGHDLHFTGVVEALEELGINWHHADVDNCWYTYRRCLYKQVTVG